jgi:hypothetical protein
MLTSSRRRPASRSVRYLGRFKPRGIVTGGRDQGPARPARRASRLADAPKKIRGPYATSYRISRSFFAGIRPSSRKRVSPFQRESA